VTIFLPISEGTFVNANDPLLVRYCEAGDRAEGVHCGMSVFGISKMTTKATMYSSTCDIEFIHPEVIDIEQLPFLSHQHVVAYRIGGSVLIDSPLWWRNRNSAPSSSSWGGGGTLENRRVRHDA